jgi:hypothetical protein
MQWEGKKKGKKEEHNKISLLSKNSNPHPHPPAGDAGDAGVRSASLIQTFFSTIHSDTESSKQF